jgi:hypothetical protein
MLSRPPQAEQNRDRSGFSSPHSGHAGMSGVYEGGSEVGNRARPRRARVIPSFEYACSYACHRLPMVLTFGSQLRSGTADFLRRKLCDERKIRASPQPHPDQHRCDPPLAACDVGRRRTASQDSRHRGLRRRHDLWPRLCARQGWNAIHTPAAEAANGGIALDADEALQDVQEPRRKSNLPLPVRRLSV